MPLQIIRQDITKIHCDAIVNAAKNSLLGGGGVDGAIHRAAGPKLLEECRTLGGCPTGQARLTGAYDLPCKYVIHTVGPVWQGGAQGEQALLTDCYRNSLLLAQTHGCESIAFPLISTGVFGYPKDRALRVAVDTIGAFLAEHDMLVYLVIYDRAGYQIGAKLFADIKTYIDDHYVDLHRDKRRRGLLHNSSTFPRPCAKVESVDLSMVEESVFEADTCAAPMVSPATAPIAALDDALKQIDESFSQMLLRKIDEKGMTDAQCYKKANIDRKLFSKIRSDIHYRPSKTTAIAFAIALELPLDEARDMLMKAGFALSHSSKFDIIVEYFIRAGNYNIYEINEALFAFDQSLLGA